MRGVYKVSVNMISREIGYRRIKYYLEKCYNVREKKVIYLIRFKKIVEFDGEGEIV